MRATVPSSKVGTGELDTKTLAGAPCASLAFDAGAWANAGPATTAASSNTSGASRIAMVTDPPLSVPLVARGSLEHGGARARRRVAKL